MIAHVRYPSSGLRAQRHDDGDEPCIAPLYWFTDVHVRGHIRSTCWNFERRGFALDITERRLARGADSGLRHYIGWLLYVVRREESNG